MNQSEKRIFLIQELLKEEPRFHKMEVPEDCDEQRRLLRSLMNIRWAAPVSEDFLKIQDDYLQEENKRRGIVDFHTLEERESGIFLWQGDITRLRVGAIVNAANSGMTGCYSPCHNCIDNCIHTYAGVALRNYCQNMMDTLSQKYGRRYEEPTGLAKITPAFNLPCDYVIHTVGPIVQGALTPEHERLLASCYDSCLRVAEEHDVDSIAFCCISTGVFHFPSERAAEIAVDTVRAHREQSASGIKVVFNVFQESDRIIYENLTGNSTK
jgi:O-acetyl-ADP-ribose deacetylase (regulator of RNase III)